MSFVRPLKRTGETVRGWAKAAPIYVEIRVRAPMSELWHHTQTPDIHSRWDLRFTAIDYLPRSNPSEPQRFRYTTRIGPWAIAGEGETVGNQERPERHTSALQFGSDDRKSIIKQGSGYWQYIQTDDGIRFLTQYSYELRWGTFGSWVDRLVFRRLISWATAWSFDRLRLWLERDLDPAVTMRNSAIHATARCSLAAVWIYQGLVPKLLCPDTGEVALLRAAGFSTDEAARLVKAVGWAEIGIGLTTIRLWNRREVFPATAGLLVALAGGALASRPAMFGAPFNPASLTAAMLALTAVGYLAGCDVPSSRSCLRMRPRSTM
jgi:hypothetical protein